MYQDSKDQFLASLVEAMQKAVDEVKEQGMVEQRKTLKKNESRLIKFFTGLVKEAREKVQLKSPIING